MHPNELSSRVPLRTCVRTLLVLAAIAIGACGSNGDGGTSLATAGAGAGMFGTTAGVTAGEGSPQAGVGAAGVDSAGVGAAGDASAGTGAGTLGTAGVGTAGDGTAGTGEPIDFEPTVENLSKDGPYAVGHIDDQPANAAYTKAAIDYPTNGTPPYDLVAVIPGYTESSAASIGWWGPLLASHGFAVIVIDTKTTNDCPDPRDKQLMTGLEVLAGENTREGSPLKGLLDITKKAVMGHSMGGGASLIAAAAHSDLKASVPMTPWSGGLAPCSGVVGPTTFGTITVPTMIIAGKSDPIAPENTHAHPFYMSIPASTPKAYMEFIDGGHNVANARNTNEALLTRYVVSFLRLEMDDDERYKAFITGPDHDAVKDMFSRYESNL